MIDQILGRPSSAVRRSEVFLVIFFWLWRLYKGDGSSINPLARHRRRNVTSRYNMSASSSMAVQARSSAWWRRVWQALFARGPGARWTHRVNQRLQSFTPYQLIIGTFTVLYAFRHLDDLLGISAPEPMAGMYSRSFYRATYVNTALDAGFASAMAIRPKWLKDIASCLFTVYYLIFSRQADEVLRRWRGFCSVEMLRTTWEKTGNPYIRFFTSSHRAKLPYVRHLTIARPSTSSRANLPPVNAMIFFDGTLSELEKATELIMDFPGGGFVAMGPESHEERLRIWAKRTGKPVLSVNYGKAPEYPYPWAIEEGIDAYRTITDSKGSVLGIKSGKLRVVLTGDSAGGNICTTIMNRILEHPKHIDRPVAMILAYPALDFNYTSWMSPTNLRVLQTEQSETHIPGLLHGKDHLAHKAPLSVVDDTGRKRRSSSKPRKSWANSISTTFGISMTREPGRIGSKSTPTSPIARTSKLPRAHSKRGSGWFASHGEWTDDSADASESDLSESDEETRGRRQDADKSLAERVKTPGVLADERFTGGILEKAAEEGEEQPRRRKAPIGTRLTMTSRVGYFQDRIITPSMMRAMAILYIGPNQSPDFETDYYISPILSPAKNLAHFPPVYLICGERDPFVDDTVIFAGKLREAKRARQADAERGQPTNRPGRHGEALRMSNENGPDHILRETDEDWVQMRIIEGWGHGFMQMNALMREIDPVLIEMADWIDESFERQTLLEREAADLSAAVVSPTDPIPSPLRSRHVKPAREYKQNPTNKALGVPDLGGFDFDGGGDDDGMISFTTKTKRRTPPSSQFIPVPRRASRENLTRNNSVPRFDADDSGSSGEIIETPPSDAFSLLPKAPTPKGAGTFALFGPRQSTPSARPPAKSPATSLYASTATSSRRGSPQPTVPGSQTPHNPLLAAVSATTRAASPALAAAGFVPQSVQNVSQAELFRRRRQEMMVAGMDGSNAGSDQE